MRNAFADEITQLAASNRQLVMLSADIGNRLFDKFKAAQSERFYNCGVAEANMISMASGLASCVLKPVCYTITPFITARCFEQIRIDVCYHSMPVIIVGTGSGLSYASLGATHHSLDDIALMRTLPGMRVFAPADSMELRSCLRAALKDPNPTYIRIGKKGEPNIFSTPPDFKPGTWNKVRSGKHVSLLAAGNMVPVAVDAAQLLEAKHISVQVFSCASIKPLDEQCLVQIFDNTSLTATIEEHSLIGGFGSAVAEWLSDNRSQNKCSLLRFGAADRFLHESGEQEHARKVFGLTSINVADKIIQALEK
jgi:transketolase